MKAEVKVEFSLGTTIEPEVNDFHWDNGQIAEFRGESYFRSEEITSTGGEITFIVEDEFEDEDDVVEWVKSQVIDDGNEIEDQNGITWVVEDIDITVELQELPLPSLDEALSTLGSFAEEHRNDEEHGEIARAALVVLDAFGSLTVRVTSLETRLEEQSQRIEGLVALAAAPANPDPEDAETA
jgi:hypothetical protein